MGFLEGLKIRDQCFGSCYLGNGREIQKRTKLALEREGKALNNVGGGWVVVEAREREGFRPVPGGSKTREQAAFRESGKQIIVLEVKLQNGPFQVFT